MRFDQRSAFVLFACGAAAACATSSGSSPVTASPSSASKNLDITVSAARPLTGADEGQASGADFTFIVDEGRILLTNPGEPNSFDLTQAANG
jgi:hypothetical protein